MVHDAYWFVEVKAIGMYRFIFKYTNSKKYESPLMHLPQLQEISGHFMAYI